MGLTVNFKVDGTEKVTIRQDNGDYITINAAEDYSFIMTDKTMMSTTFFVNRYQLYRPAEPVAGMHEDPNAAPRPTPEQINNDAKERGREQQTLAQRDEAARLGQAEIDKRASGENDGRGPLGNPTGPKSATETTRVTGSQAPKPGPAVSTPPAATKPSGNPSTRK